MAKPRPLNQVLLTVPQAFTDEIVTESGLKLYLDSSYSKEWNAAVIATIADLPLKVLAKHQHIFDKLKVGDTVAISYQIVADFTFGSDAKQFIQATEDNPHHKEFVNGMGEWIRMYALPKRSGLEGVMWCATYTNKYRQFVDGVQGDEEEVYRWMSQFAFGKTDRFTFNNYFEFDGKDYWKADLDDIFAVKRKGHWVAVSDRVICRPIEEKVPDPYLIAAHKGHDVKMRFTDRARVITGGKEKNIKKDSVVSFDPRHLEKYTFDNKEFYLIKQSMVVGTWQ